MRYCCQCEMLGCAVHLSVHSLLYIIHSTLSTYIWTSPWDNRSSWLGVKHYWLTNYMCSVRLFGHRENYVYTIYLWEYDHSYVTHKTLCSSLSTVRYCWQCEFCDVCSMLVGTFNQGVQVLALKGGSSLSRVSCFWKLKSDFRPGLDHPNTPAFFKL